MEKNIGTHWHYHTRLTRRVVQWKKTTEHNKVLQEVKKLDTTACILSYYDPKAELEIQCDVSLRGLMLLPYKVESQSLTKEQ